MFFGRLPHRALVTWRHRLLAVLCAVALGLVPTAALAVPSSASTTSDGTASEPETVLEITGPESVYAGDVFSIRVVPGTGDVSLTVTPHFEVLSARAEGGATVWTLRAGLTVGPFDIRVHDASTSTSLPVDIVKRPTSITIDAPETATPGVAFEVSYGLEWEGGPAPTGDLQIDVASTELHGPLRGGRFTTTQPGGPKIVTVSYRGDEHYAAATKTVTIDVIRVLPEVVVSFQPSNPEAGEDVVATATLTGFETGRGGNVVYTGAVDLTLPDGRVVALRANPIAPTVSSARVTFVARPGVQSVVATTEQNDYFDVASGQASVDVDRVVTTLSIDVPAAHALAERTITVTAESRLASVTPTGQVRLTTDGGVDLGTVDLVDGAGDWTGTLPVGEHEVVASYAGDDAAAPTTASTRVVVARAPTETSVHLPPLTFGEDAVATVEVVVPGAPGAVVPGEVELSAGGEPLGTAALVDGRASVTIPGTLGAGAVTIDAAYLGSTETDVSSGSSSTVVERAVPAVGLTAPATLTLGQSWEVEVDVRARGAAAPDPGAPEAAGSGGLAGLASQHATVSSARLAPLAAPAGTVGTGTVTVLLDGAQTASATLVDGRATVTVDSTAWQLSPGTHTLTVAYEGDTNFEAWAVDTVLDVEAATVVVPPVVVPPVVVPPVVGPGEPETTPTPGAGPAPVPTPLAGAARPPLAEVPTPHRQAAAAGDLARTGASSTTLLLLGPLLLAGGVLLAARRSRVSPEG